MQTGLDSATMIKQSIRLSEYISRYTNKEIRGDGPKKRTACPIHGGDNPTAFSIDDDIGLWKCNSDCGRGGSIIDFWMMYNKNDDFGSAVEALSKEVGVKLPERTSNRPSKRRIHDALLDITEAAHAFLTEREDPDAVLAYEYLRDRGLTRRMIRKWAIGFIPSGEDAVEFAHKACKDSAALVQGGFLTKRDHSEWVAMNGRILFPIMDQKDDVIGFSARKIDGVNSSGSGKYVNTPETDVYHKSKVLYGMNLIDQKTSTIYLPEGQLDAIALNAVLPEGSIAASTCGTAFTRGHSDLLRQADSIVEIFDGDRPGKNATMKSLWMLDEFPNRVSAVILEDDKDPCDLFKQDKEALLQAVATQRPLIEIIPQAKWELVEGDDHSMREWIRTEVSQTVTRTTDRDRIISATAMMLGKSVKGFKSSLSLPDVLNSKRNASKGDSGMSPSAKVITSALLSIQNPDTRIGVLAPLSRWSSDDNEVIDSAVKGWLPFSTDMDFSVLKRLSSSQDYSANPMVDRALSELMPDDPDEESTDIGGVLEASLRQLMHGMSQMNLNTEHYLVSQIRNIKKAREIAKSKRHQMMILAYLIEMAVDVEFASTRIAEIEHPQAV